jgi:hypothetical protein
MKRTLAVAAVVAASLTLGGCLATLDDGGRYDGYRQSVLDLAKAHAEVEKARIQALGDIALTADARTQDRIIAELSGRSQHVPQGPQIAAPPPPTHLGLEALRILGPGAIGLIGQGIGAYAQNQADQLATERHLANNALIGGAVEQAISSSTMLGFGQQGLTGQAMELIPPTYSTTVIQQAAPAAEPAPVAQE